MCTVTFVPKKDGFAFASNRDEQPLRKTTPPAYYKENGILLFYPKDEVAGGTWIGLSEHERVVCLLNGGNVYHNPAIKFPKSRGGVVKTLLTTTNVLETMQKVDLEGVAPFTLIVVEWKAGLRKLYELVWCKNRKTIQELDPQANHIWSSSTLYTPEMKQERKAWFAALEGAKTKEVSSDLLKFHQNEDLGTTATTPKMKREVVETVSTTFIEKNANSISLEYHDYVKDSKETYEDLFQVVKV